jgi:hypothetical protein
MHHKHLLSLNKTLNGKLSTRLTKDVKHEIDNLTEKIYNISSGNNLNFYYIKTAELIERYKKILQQPIKISFTGKSITNNKEKNIIISEYLEIAKNFIKLETKTKNKVKIIYCANCDNKDNFDIINDNIYICLYCGSEQEIFTHTSSYKDIDRINISVKYTYDRKTHFSDCINQYQGIQNCYIDPDIYTKLIEQFNKNHLLLPGKNKYRNITKENIHIFLKYLGYSKQYENINLIYSEITGQQCDNISKLEERLLYDFDLLSNLYDKKFKNNPKFDRKNFINTHYVLYQLLLKHSHKCDKKDFTVLKTIERKNFHDDITKILFDELGWKHTPLF